MSLKSVKKQLVFARASLILTNYFLPLNEALCGSRLMCNCQSLGECVEAAPTRNQFVGNFSKLDHSSKLWAELFICKSCGQHWIVEKGAEMDRRTNKAFKISKPDNWLEYDTNSALASWLISQHGGTSEQECAFSGCNNMALKSMAVCVEHGHSEYVWSKTT